MPRTFSALMLAVVVAWFAGVFDTVAAQTCGTPFRVLQKSFKRLDARNAYVWVDDIESSGSRYKPFRIAVVVGNAYPPFKAAEGRLARSSFESLIRSSYGVTPTYATVSDAALRKGVSVSFTSAKQAFVLRVDTVTLRQGGEDAIAVRLCR